jgi:hypothetical protein
MPRMAPEFGNRNRLPTCAGASEHPGLRYPLGTVLLTDLNQLIACALVEPALFGGGLVRSQNPEVAWLLTSRIQPEVLSSFRAHSDAAVVTSGTLSTSPEWASWVIGYQVFGHQHRWFLPLLGPDVAMLAREVGSTGVRLWMDAGPQCTLVEARVPVSNALGASLRHHCKPSCASSALAGTLLTTAARLLAPAALRPAHGTPHPSTVSVTAVIPSDLWLDVESETAAALWHASRVSTPDRS